MAKAIKMTPEQARKLVAERGLETREQALHARVEQLVAKWGEAERDASRRQQRDVSHALLLNSIAVHDLDAIDDLLMAAAAALMTSDDRRALRQGG